MQAPQSPLSKFWHSFVSWFDTWARSDEERNHPKADGINYVRCIPFVGLHLMCFAAFWAGFSWVALGAAVLFYVIRMFAVTGFYHRYFSHRTFQTSRVGQFLFALLGATATQRGPMWWAAHHRHHHKHSDEHADVHSAKQHGLFQSHVGWILTRKNFPTDLKYVRDLEKYPELCFLDRFDTFVPILFAVFTFYLGVALEAFAPSLGTNGFQMLVWGFFISTVALFHGTCTINSLSHIFGKRVYETADESKNNWLLAFVTLGEGWHNNHHYFQGSTRQGFLWWQVDITFYILKVLSWFHIVWDLHPVPDRVLKAAKPQGI